MKSTKLLDYVAAGLACAALLVSAPTALAKSAKPLDRDDKMSEMGKRAAAAVAKITQGTTTSGSRVARNAVVVKDGNSDCINEPDCRAAIVWFVLRYDGSIPCLRDFRLGTVS